MYNPFSLQDKNVLLTGASSGIGRATAIACSKMGAKLLLTGRNQIRLQETLNSLEGQGHRMVVLDLADPAAISKLIDETEPLDGLVNNAGMAETLPVEFIDQVMLSRTLTINTQAPILLTSGLAKQRKLKKGASVVFTSSIGGNIIAHPGNSMYAASKGAVSGFVRAAALELARRQIRVNAVCPGMIHTNILGDSITEAQLQEDAKKYPLKRYGRAEEVAYAIIYLLSDAASFVTGSNLVIDGGYTIQ